MPADPLSSACAAVIHPGDGEYCAADAVRSRGIYHENLKRGSAAVVYGTGGHLLCGDPGVGRGGCDSGHQLLCEDTGIQRVGAAGTDNGRRLGRRAEVTEKASELLQAESGNIYDAGSIIDIKRTAVRSARGGFGQDRDGGGRGLL